MKMLFKTLKLCISVAILFWMASIFPSLQAAVTINGGVGLLLGIVYIKDPTGRYHHGWSGRYVSREEAFCLSCFLPLLGVGVPVITIFSLPMMALEQLLTSTFGAELIGLVGGTFSIE